MSQWVRGKKKPTASSLDDICKTLNIAKQCLTDGFPVCTQDEHDEIERKLNESLKCIRIIDTDDHNRTKALFEYLTIFGKQYCTFDFEVLNSGIADNKVIFRIIESLLSKNIEEYFLTFGIIQTTEKRCDNGKHTTEKE